MGVNAEDGSSAVAFGAEGFTEVERVGCVAGWGTVRVSGVVDGEVSGLAEGRMEEESVEEDWHNAD